MMSAMYPTSYIGNNSSRYYTSFGENTLPISVMTTKNSMVNSFSHRIYPMSIETTTLTQRNDNISPSGTKQ
jgi:hypothetical protein